MDVTGDTTLTASNLKWKIFLMETGGCLEINPRENLVTKSVSVTDCSVSIQGTVLSV